MKILLLKGKNFWQVNISSNASWSWRSTLKAREWVRPLIAVKIGNGCSSSLWFDAWVGRKPLVELLTSHNLQN